MLARGAVGHNHFGFRRFAIEAALQSEAWDEAEAQADALARRTAAEPLPYSNLIIERGRILARIGRGTAREEDAKDLAALRARAAEADFRIDALRGRAAGGVGGASNPERSMLPLSRRQRLGSPPGTSPSNGQFRARTGMPAFT